MSSSSRRSRASPTAQRRSVSRRERMSRRCQVRMQLMLTTALPLPTGLGPRTIEMPELQEGAVAAPAPGDVPDEGGGEEEEDEEARAAEEEILPYPMEKLLEDDLPFQLFPLSMKAPESTTSSYKQNLLAKGLQTARDLFPIKFGRPARSQGLLKMKLRVIKYERCC